MSSLAYYHGAEKVGTLDVPLADGQIVSINLVDELADDPDELIGFLKQEHGARKYWTLIANAYCANGKLSEAKRVIDEARNQADFTQGDRDALDIYLGWLELKNAAAQVGTKRQDFVSGAKDILAKLPDQVASLVLARLLAAEIAVFEEKTDDARAIFDEILKKDANNCFALMGKAQMALTKKNYLVALKLYQQVLMINPLMRPDPRVGIGMCFWMLNDEIMAKRLWQRSLELYPGSQVPEVLLALAKFNDTLVKLVTDNDFVENYKLSIEKFALLQKNGQFVPAFVVVSYLFSKNKYDQVVEAVAAIIKPIVPDLGDDMRLKLAGSKYSSYEKVVLSQGALWLGRVEFAKGNFTQAQKHFGELIKLDDSLVAKLGMGLAQLARGSVEDAIMTYELILKTDAKCLEVMYLLGVLYSQLKLKRKQELAVAQLERYLRLANGVVSKNEESSGKEPVAMNALLVLSKLYEAKDMGQSLVYLQRAIDIQKQIGRDAPLEVYNNIGVYQFMRKKFDDASSGFDDALARIAGPFVDENGDTLVDLPGDLEVTIKFNQARLVEVGDQNSAVESYKQLVEQCPHYFSAKLRLLFLQCISAKTTAFTEIKQEIDDLLKTHALELEIRSFYGWFIKNFGKKVGLKPDDETSHQKDTLVEYDSHDCYALISLANIYCFMARDAKNDESKRRKYYLRAVELYTKVLLIDSKDVYAAQGLAIAYIENKETTKGLDILRKIRDLLNEICVYLNLGHALLEAKNFSKAIENYEIALGRFTDGKDTKILSFLGRAWYLRGQLEQHLPYLKRAKEYTVQALEASNALGSIKFNLAFIEFQIAEFITKQSVGQRKIEEIEAAISDLNGAIDALKQLTDAEDDSHMPYPKADLQARANLGSTALLPRLQACLEETKLSIEEINARLESAKKLREEEEEKKRQEAEARVAAAKQEEEERAKERAKLQEQAQQWADEFRAANVGDEDNDDAKEENGDEKEKKPRGTKRKAEAKGGRRKKRAALSDDEESEAEDKPETEDEDDGLF